MSEDSLLAQAHSAIQAGDKKRAQKILRGILRRDRGQVQAWLGLAACLDDPQKKRYCLQKALALRADLPRARQALERLQDPPPARLKRAQQPVKSKKTPPAKPVQAGKGLPGKKLPGDRLPGDRPHKPAPPPAPGPVPGGKPAPKCRPGLSQSQLSLLAALVLVILTAWAGFGFTIVNGESLAWQSATLSAASTRSSPAAEAAMGTPTSAVFQFPATWTPSVEPSGTAGVQDAPPTASATPPAALPAENGLYPSATPPASPTPIPSLTPVNELHWTIGYSVAGQPIEVYRFGKGRNGRMIVAGIHGGNEWNTIELAYQLIDHLRAHPEIVPPGISLYILPSLNPDGEARVHGVDGRVNENGVDLNRNWDANWQQYWPRQGCWDYRPTHGGAYAHSEPETQALANFLHEHRIDALINYHSAALGIFPAGNPYDPTSIRLAEAVAAVTDYPYPPIDTGCIYNATLVDWAVKLGIAGIDLELTNHTHTDFEINLRVLDVFLNWQR